MPLIFLAASRPARTGALGGLDRLAVDHAGRQRGIPPHRLSRQNDERVADGDAKPAVAPAVEVVLHRGHRRGTGRRQHAPGQPTPHQVEQRLDDLPIAPPRRSPPPRQCRKHLLQHRPFRVRQVAWQTQPLPGMLLAGDISPHCDPLRCFTTPMESQGTDITQLIFRSGSNGFGRNSPAGQRSG